MHIMLLRSLKKSLHKIKKKPNYKKIYELALIVMSCGTHQQFYFFDTFYNYPLQQLPFKKLNCR